MPSPCAKRMLTGQAVGTAATTMMPNYPERVPGSVFAGDALYDAVDPVGPARWSLGLRLHDPARANEATPGISEDLSTETMPCAAEDGGCARSSANIRANAFPSRADALATDWPGWPGWPGRAGSLWRSRPVRPGSPEA